MASTLLPLYRREPDGSESRFLVETRGRLTEAQATKLRRSLAILFRYLPTHEVTLESTLKGRVATVGTRVTYETPFSSNAVEIAQAVGFEKVQRIEHFRGCRIPRGADPRQVLAGRYDRVTEDIYESLPTTFRVDVEIPPVEVIPLLEEGRPALDKFLADHQISFKPVLVDRIEKIFTRMGRNPTDVAIYQLLQIWSDHCWHVLFMLTRFVIDGVAKAQTLIEILREPLEAVLGTSADNIKIAMHDNASAVEGYTVPVLVAAHPGEPGPFVVRELTLHALFSAESHNYPGHVAPYPGAATEIGGEIRDEIGAGQGSDIYAAFCGRVVGSLRFPNRYRIPGEFVWKWRRQYIYPADKAEPMEVVIQGLQGWHDYANCFGKPLVAGFFYSGAVWRPRRLSNGRIVWEHLENLKPCCFGGAIGVIREAHLVKGEPQRGMRIVRLGGEARPIGFCGGSGSSSTSGSNTAAFDENAVQRGAPVMERLVYETIYDCNQLDEATPIVSDHDQGAGGLANVFFELIARAGGRIYLGVVKRGDPTMPDVKVWVCEFQESQGVLVWDDGYVVLERIANRHGCPIETIGVITGDGRFELYHEANQAEVEAKQADPIVQFDNMGEILEKIGIQEIIDETPEILRIPIAIPSGMSFDRAFRRTLRRSEVGSKEWITRGCDGTIGGLTIRNQYCGPFATPINDFGLVALSSLTDAGMGISIGVAPYLTALDAAAGARMSVAEMYTNAMGLYVGDIERIKTICNWMWPATITPPDGEIALLLQAAEAVRAVLLALASAIIGGKDSSSMATCIRNILIKSIETVIFSTAVPVEDVGIHVTPDLKLAGESSLILVDIANGRRRLGGSSFGQSLGQLGDYCPDLDDIGLFRRAFAAIQEMLLRKLIVSGHDVSSGGLATTVAEMCFAAGCGASLSIRGHDSPFNELLAEELGFVVEVPGTQTAKVTGLLEKHDIPHRLIGQTLADPEIRIRHNGEEVLRDSTWVLRRQWERTGHQLRRLRVDPKCADQEWRNTRLWGTSTTSG